MTTRSSVSEDTQIALDTPSNEGAVLEDVEKQSHAVGDGNETDPNIVVWDKDDKDNPFNWPSRIKVWITFQLGMLAMAGSLASSIVSPANETISNYLGVSKEVGVLSVSLYM
jgi:hypothetical protein